jgi:sec-independent protein translocase protein TatB
MSPPGFWEWIFLAVLALLIFGPDKLPGIASSVGKTLGQLKREAQSTIDELKRTAELDELRKVADDLRSTGRELRTQACPDRPGRRTTPASPSGPAEPTAQGPHPTAVRSRRHMSVGAQPGRCGWAGASVCSPAPGTRCRTPGAACRRAHRGRPTGYSRPALDRR